jgi:hypothetical protein
MFSQVQMRESRNGQIHRDDAFPLVFIKARRVFPIRWDVKWLETMGIINALWGKKDPWLVKGNSVLTFHQILQVDRRPLKQVLYGVSRYRSSLSNAWKYYQTCVELYFWHLQLLRRTVLDYSRLRLLVKMPKCIHCWILLKTEISVLLKVSLGI